MDTSGPSHKCQDFVRVALIHRSAWKVNSANFRFTAFYEVRLCATPRRLAVRLRPSA